MQKFLGLIILLAVAVSAAFFILGKEKVAELSGSGPKKVSSGVVIAAGRAGSEKINFLQSKKVQEQLLEQGLKVEVRKSGSVEMVQEAVSGDDFLWPASQGNVESFKNSGSMIQQTADIFNSPLVLFMVTFGHMQALQVRDQPPILLAVLCGNLDLTRDSASDPGIT